MALTKEQLTKVVANRLLAKHYKALGWSDVNQVMSSPGAAAKAEIVTALINKQPKAAGEVLLRLIDKRVKAKAEAEAASMLLDDSLTLEELETILT